MLQKLIVLLFIAILSLDTNAQITADTVTLTLPQAEKIFLDSNLQLLAQKYNIDAQQALIIQARLWPNPNLSLSRGPIIPIFDSQSNYPHSNFFLHSETSAGISQLILLAGKRNKQIKLAQANAALARYQFFDLLRTLKYTLRIDFFNIYYLQQSAKVYEVEIKALEQIVNAFAEQQGKGYISEKEVIRIRAQLYSFRNEYSDLVNQINDIQSEFRLVLQMKPSVYINPLPDSVNLKSLNPDKYSFDTLIDSAYTNRTDLQIARTNTNINKLTYSYQKALAVPDLIASFSYDKQGSYATNFNAVGLAMDLPFFNRNQGNIRSARSMIDYSAALEKTAEATVSEDVARSLQKAYAQNKLYRGIDPSFSGDFERLMNEVLINYKKRNISILDFLDFYDSYKQNMLQLNSIQFSRVNAFEEINFYTGTEFFQP
ncbi:MAG: TolC family protein [Chitinophagales bacterium]